MIRVYDCHGSHENCVQLILMNGDLPYHFGWDVLRQYNADYYICPDCVKEFKEKHAKQLLANDYV